MGRLLQTSITVVQVLLGEIILLERDGNADPDV